MRAHEIFSKQHSATAPHGTLLFVRGWDLHSTLTADRVKSKRESGDTPIRHVWLCEDPHGSVVGAVYVHVLRTLVYGYQQCDAFEKLLFLLFRVVAAPKIESLLHITCGADGLLPSVQLMCRTYLQTLKWEVLLHTPYSPDISPSDYYSFRSMAHGLSDQQFRSYEDIEKWLNSWIASKDEHFYRNGIRALPERWGNVVANDGQYFKLMPYSQNIWLESAILPKWSRLC